MAVAQALDVILVADDNPDDLYLLRRLLSKAGVKNPVVSLRDGNEVVSFLKPVATAGESGVRPWVVFLDIKMPKLDGFETLRWIRKQEALKALPVFVLSGSDEPRDVRRATELGATRYVVKHPPAEVFARLLEEQSSDR
jgi:two-component system response regulator